MKNIILYFLILFSGIIYSQELIVHELNPPNATEHADLEVLGSLVKDKQIIMLGEMTHKYENIFEMKARVVKYLHKELGFTTLALELPMYEIWKLNQKSFDTKGLKSILWDFWAESESFQELIEYIEDNNIKVVGFDSQVNAVPEFVDNFLAYIKKNKIKIRLDEDDLGVVIEDILDVYVFEEEDFSFSRYKREIESILNQIRKLPDTEENYYWLQFTKGILSESLTTFYNTEDLLLNPDFVDKYHNYRDAQMADNLISYSKRHPEEKIIAWADNIHIIKDISSYKHPIIKEFVSMGEHVSKALEDKSYSLATLHANDSLFDSTQGRWFETPIEENSFEAQLLAKNKDYLFVDSHQPALQQDINSRLLSFVNFHKGRVDQLHDGYIFLKKASDADEPEEEESHINENITGLEIQETTEKENTSYSFTGKIIDAKTLNPVPYANVMLKDLGVYRLTDENGNYSIQIPTDKNIELTFLSMTYEELTLPVNQLKEIIELTPGYESLGEVVLVGYGTTPKKVLKQAISNIKENYVLKPFNFNRYGHYKLYQEDELIQELEVISKDYISSYRSNLPVLGKVEQVKRNKTVGANYKHKGLQQANERLIVKGIRTKTEDNYKSLKELRSFREDAIQFASILHKRRFNKFDLEFVTTDSPEDEGMYIIKFKTKRKSFGYTNRWYPADYSGVIYINKEDFAVVKVVQNWETTLFEEQIPKYYHWLGKFKDKLIYKVEYISEYKKQDDGKYYASRYYSRDYGEETTLEDEFYNGVFEEESFLYNYTTENVEVFEFSLNPITKETDLQRVPYNPEFWKNFDLEDLK